MHTVTKDANEKVGIILENAMLSRRVLVADLKPGSKLAGLGIQRGDIVRSVNGTKVSDATAASKLIAEATQLTLCCTPKPPAWRPRATKRSLLVISLLGAASAVACAPEIAWRTHSAVLGKVTHAALALRQVLDGVTAGASSALSPCPACRCESASGDGVARLARVQRDAELERFRLESELAAMRTARRSH